MKFTIGIPYYKSLKSLKRLVAALQEQIIHDEYFEVIIVNDDLQDKINKEFFQRTNFSLRVFNKKHEGVAAARNKIIELASGDIVLFLDQDCIPVRSWFLKMTNAFKRDINIDGVGGQILPLLESGLIRDYFNFSNFLKRPIISKKSGEIVAIITGNSGFRLSTLRAVGGFDQEIFDSSSHGGEDVDITYRLIKAGYRIVYEPSVIVFHEYPNNLSSIFFKYANYARGMRLFCLARNIKPNSIGQSNLNIFAVIVYFLKIPYNTILSFLNFRKRIGFIKSLYFSFFEFVKYLGHGYGYFNSRYKIKTVFTGK